MTVDHSDLFKDAFILNPLTGVKTPIKARVTKMHTALTRPAGRILPPRFGEQKPYDEQINDFVRTTIHSRAETITALAKEMNVPVETLEFTDRRTAAWDRRNNVMPPFLQDELDREDQHSWQVRRDKKRKELAEMYGAAPAKWLDAAADQQTPHFPPSPPVDTIHEHYVMGAGPVRYQYSYDAVTRQEQWSKLPSCAAAPMVTGSGGWIAPVEVVYGPEAPTPQTVNHPCTVFPFPMPDLHMPLKAPELHPCSPSCKLNIDAPGIVFPTWLHGLLCQDESRQEEGPTSMYTHDARRIAAQQLLEERNNREAMEIIERIKAFGDDTYADGTIFRFTRQLFKDSYGVQLAAPAVWSALRSTNDCGRIEWHDDQGTSHTWENLVSWFVTVGKPITLDDIEIFPPAKFPAASGTVVETVITGTVQ